MGRMNPVFLLLPLISILSAGCDRSKCASGVVFQGNCLPVDCPLQKCPQGFVCLAQACLEVTCLQKDCPAGTTCAGGQCYPVDCTTHNCPAQGEVCVNEECVPSSCLNIQCPTGQLCAAGQCYPKDCPEETCSGNSEVCVDQACQERSCVGISCPSGQACAQGLCYPADCESQGCLKDTEVCVDGVCVPKTCAGVKCDGGLQCQDSCCQPTCAFGNECSLFTCTDTYLCKPDFATSPSSYSWVQVDPGNPVTINCDLSPDISLLPATECTGNNQQIAFHCSRDGTCANGTCSLPANPLARSHDCGGAFGCDPATGKCRTHFQAGQACWYNYDCESFCCSRDYNAQCIAFNDTACKVFTTYRLDINTFTAKGTTDLHDMTQWSWAGGDHADTCSNDRDCDSGHCTWIPIVGNRCSFASMGCIDTSDDNHTRGSYFCEASGGQADHLILVTNQDPNPPDSECNR